MCLTGDVAVVSFVAGFQLQSDLPRSSRQELPSAFLDCRTKAQASLCACCRHTASSGRTVAILLYPVCCISLYTSTELQV